ncbi:hypothetical protein ACF0H5_023044 [Mactra antiquata]
MKLTLVSLLLVTYSVYVSGKDCPGFSCTYNGMVFCQHIPCPLPPCDQPLVLTPGDCCEHCPSTDHVRQTGDCPHPCEQGGQHYCHPIPCPLPPCHDAVTKPGVCCPSCPHGPDCMAPDGHVILFKHSRIIDGKNCTCEMPPGDATCV